MNSLPAMAFDRYLVRGDEVFALRRQGSGGKCCHGVSSGVHGYCVRPHGIVDDEAVFGFRDCTREMAVLLPLFIVVFFDGREDSAKFVFETIDGLGGYDAVQAGHFVLPID